MKIIATYTPKNDVNMPWLAGELSPLAPEFNAAEKSGLVKGYLNEKKSENKTKLDSYKSPIPVFYVGNNDNTFFGKYDRNASWFPRSLKKGDIAQKKGECYQLNDICINGIPFFIRKNETGTEYVSDNLDTILLVDKKDGADDGVYTTTQLTRTNMKYEIPNIGALHGKSFDLKSDIPFPYYNHPYVQKIYNALKEKIEKCTGSDLCDSFTKRAKELPNALIEHAEKWKQALHEQPGLGGNRHKKKTRRSKRTRRRTRRQ